MSDFRISQELRQLLEVRAAAEGVSLQSLCVMFLWWGVSDRQMTVWLVGQAKDEKGSAHDVQGVFTAKEKALAACLTDLYWVAELELDVNAPHERVEYEHAWYPLREKEPVRSANR